MNLTYIPVFGKKCVSMKTHCRITIYHLVSQMGKFYELFHMDATVAVNELGLLYMKVRGFWKEKVLL